MGEYTNQHIVPKRYINRFALGKGDSPRICVRRESNGCVKCFYASTDDVGYVKNIYTISDRTDSKYWEHYFAEKIDSLSGRDLSNIISSVTLSPALCYSISEAEKEVLSKLMCAQMLRTPASLDFARTLFYGSVSPNVKKELIAKYPDFRDKIASVNPSENKIKNSYLKAVFSKNHFRRLCHKLRCREWRIIVNGISSIIPFVTSDNPILVEYISGEKCASDLESFGAENVRYFFPLTPRIAVMNFNSRNISTDCHDMIIVKDPKFIIDKNKKTVDQAFQHSFLPPPLNKCAR